MVKTLVDVLTSEEHPGPAAGLPMPWTVDPEHRGIPGASIARGPTPAAMESLAAPDVEGETTRTTPGRSSR